MASKRCMNGGCGSTSPAGEWRKGWELRSGGFATLCDKCGMAYEESVFCDLFHQKESGWRECLLCGKRVHCGCIASKSLLDLLDSGGVQCISCMKNSGYAYIPNEAIQEFFPQHSHSVPAIMSRCLKDEEMNDDIGFPQAGGACRLQHACTGHGIEEDTVSKGKVVQSGKSFEINEKSSVPLDKRESVNESLDHIKLEELALQIGEVGSSNATNQHHACIESSQVSQEDDGEHAIMNSMICGSLMQAYSTISLENSNQNKFTEAPPVSGTQLIALPLANEINDARDQNKALSTFQQSERARHLLPKPRRAGLDVASEASKEVLSHMRVARPPVEGRGRNQLLPRYWPRITDQELQQISGDSNSTIVPLFEKVLSASDAGRIGRLVLPKACAEAYFPPISQPEGLPLKIQDAKGKEWHFQFRFWPNNNSRMYVLEGVTPCIQSLQLQAGDTVTFSRMDPEGKFVMGFRKATNSLPLQDAFQIPSIANVALRKETYFSGFTGNLPIVSAYSGLLQSLKETADPHLSCSSEHLNSADVNISWKKTDKHGGRVSEGLLQPLLIQETNKSRNIGVKSKRLHMDNEDALELKLSWEEAQDLLSPPPSAKPSIVVIEDHEFEEYEDAPVFGKKTIFTARISGEKDQWIQCDDCSRWRRLPVDILVSSKWTCAENTWDVERSSCSALDELSERDLQIVLRQNTELKRQRATISKQSSLELEIASLDPLASAAALGDMTGEASASSGATTTTTKHPRHRPGCTCIVCIQPPSGTGPKHNPKCTCNVCLTVKRRFKTLMARKKQRQSEREETDAHKRLLSNWTNKDETEKLAIGKGQLDLNSQPDRDGELQADKALSLSRMSMVSLLQVANLPLENYLKQNGLTSLVNERQVGTSSTVPQTRTADESEEGTPAECCFVSVAQEQDSCSGEK